MAVSSQCKPLQGLHTVVMVTNKWHQSPITDTTSQSLQGLQGLQGQYRGYKAYGLTSLHGLQAMYNVICVFVITL